MQISKVAKLIIRSVGGIALLGASVSADAAFAEFIIPSGEYSVFTRSNGFVEIRTVGTISSRTSTPFDCADNSILTLCNASNSATCEPNRNLHAALLTAYAAQSDINVGISDDPADKDLNNNCGVRLIEAK